MPCVCGLRQNQHLCWRQTLPSRRRKVPSILSANKNPRHTFPVPCEMRREHPVVLTPNRRGQRHSHFRKNVLCVTRVLTGSSSIAMKFKIVAPPDDNMVTVGGNRFQFWKSCCQPANPRHLCPVQHVCAAYIRKGLYAIVMLPSGRLLHQTLTLFTGCSARFRFSKMLVPTSGVHVTLCSIFVTITSADCDANVRCQAAGTISRSLQGT